MIALLPPFEVSIMDLYLLTTLLPGGHLNVLVLVIGCDVSVLDNVDMEPLCLLSVVVVSTPKKLDRFTVMDHTVYLRQVEVVADAKINKYILIIVKSSKGIVQACEGGCGVGWQLCQEKEVEDSPYNCDDLLW